jgi:hypothetical protein
MGLGDSMQGQEGKDRRRRAPSGFYCYYCVFFFVSSRVYGLWSVDYVVSELYVPMGVC